jgi:hypothetical protein
MGEAEPVSAYRYLTRSYVEWLGLDEVPVRTMHRGVISSYQAQVRFTGEPLPPALASHAILPGVVHDSDVYVREGDGLAYVR